MHGIPIIIPAYEPDERLIRLLEELAAKRMGPIVIVNDGSGADYDALFATASQLVASSNENPGTLLVHETNRGKGAALKTAFSYVLETYPQAQGVVTADSDGQHTATCIERVRQALSRQPDTLVLGVREFDGESVPWKSRMGNHLTSWVFARLTGMRISDTQTGLRGIPRSLMHDCLNLPGDRFEFEMQMLTCARGTTPVTEVPIVTVYDSKDNHQTHFDPVADSLRIYRTLLREPLAFALSSVASFVVDISLFALFCRLLRGMGAYVAISTVAARIISAVFNFLLNSHVVFKTGRKDSVAGPRYALLAVAIMSLSAAFSTWGTTLLPLVPEVVVKVVVDAILFLLSYFVQKRLVF